MKIYLESADFGNYIIAAEDGRTIYVQSDWEYPAWARAFGKEVACCDMTDGTVNCPVHGTLVDEMIGEAAAWLSENAGWAEADDLYGYFEEEKT